MLDFKTGHTLGLLARTLPFVLLRVMVYVGIAFAYALAVGVGAGIGLLFGKIGGNGDTGAGAGLGGLIGFVVACGILYWAREYLLYLVKAGHVAVLVRMIDGKPLPSNQGQIAFGRDRMGQPP